MFVFKNRLAILCLFFLSFEVSAFESYYLSASLEKGEGSYSLLRRYKLDVSACNINKFFELNEIDKNTALDITKEYLLPIQIVNYNGKSIRSTLSIDDWDTAVAIKEYNELIKQNNIRKTHYTDSKILWVPHHIINCNVLSVNEEVEKKKDIVEAKEKAEQSPSGAKSAVDQVTKETKSKEKIAKGNIRVQPIFGEKYKNVSIKDESLKNKVYYIVSGHGGPDPGAMCNTCPNVLCEDEYAYDIALRLARNLMEKGATVHMIIQDKDGIRDAEVLECDNDELCMGTVKIPLDQLKRLNQRTNKINQLYHKYKQEGIKEQYAIALHIDSNHKDKRRDVFFYHYKNGKTGKNLAEHMLSTFAGKYEEHQKGRGYNGFVKGRNLYIVRNTLPPIVFLELGNINNISDQKRITYVKNREALAEWICDGFSNFKS